MFNVDGLPTASGRFGIACLASSGCDAPLWLRVLARRIAASASGFALLVPLAAVAQITGKPADWVQPRSLPVVVVSGRGVPSPDFDVPAAIGVVDSDDSVVRCQR